MKRAVLAIGVLATILITVIVATRHHSAPAPEITRSDHGGEAGHTDLGPQPSQASPATVAEQGLSLMFSWAPVTDPGPGAALGRARAWLTGHLAAAADSPSTAAVRPPAAWASWQRSGDVVTASVRADRDTVCAPQTCAVTAHLTQTVLHRDGAATPYADSTVLAALARTTQGWRLASYRITA